MRIRQIARENGVPIVLKLPLARHSSGRSRLAEVFPVSLQAVAEVLAYVYRLKKKEERLVDHGA